MAQPPVGRNGGDSAAADASRSIPTPFLTKTYQLVEDSSLDDVISWNEDGSAFVVWNPTEFARNLLPKYFKHNNFSSFVRQLNTYGFRKMVSDRWEFANECFRRGQFRLLRDIQRRKLTNSKVAASSSPAPAPVTVAVASPVQPMRTLSANDSGDEQVISSNSSPGFVPLLLRQSVSGTDTFLAGENERLRRENMQLHKELSEMKSLCNNIYVMMSHYGKNKSESTPPQAAAATPLDLLPLKRLPDDSTMSNSRSETEEEGSPRLFGFPIGGNKRARESTEEVKSEPLDDDNSGEGVDDEDKSEE